MKWPWMKTKPNPFTGIDFMNLVPVQSKETERDEDTGITKVLIPRYESWPFNRLIQPRLGPAKRYIRVPLEDRGCFLWGAMDGQKSVGELIPLFLDQFPSDKDDAPKRVSMYLFSMYQNGFISFKNLPKL